MLRKNCNRVVTINKKMTLGNWKGSFREESLDPGIVTSCGRERLEKRDHFEACFYINDLMILPLNDVWTPFMMLRPRKA